MSKGHPNKEQMRAMGKDVRDHLPEGYGFCVFVFPMNRLGIMSHISNGNRDDLIKALRDYIDRMENNDSFFPQINDN